MLGYEHRVDHPYRAHLAYYLEGDAESADITVSTASGTSQQQGVDVPLMNKNGEAGLHYYGPAVPGFAYISAQNNGSGDLTCRIELDGKVIAQNTSSGRYAIVTCKAST
ncbi:MAG: hypothetical protein HZY73_11110 [Micropruina sp.]|nr:MAG: hypothetical protein HZY73_11110 [Micropruina sp.]